MPGPRVRFVRLRIADAVAVCSETMAQTPYPQTDRELMRLIERSRGIVRGISNWFVNWGWAVGASGGCCWSNWRGLRLVASW